MLVPRWKCVVTWESKRYAEADCALNEWRPTDCRGCLEPFGRTQQGGGGKWVKKWQQNSTRGRPGSGKLPSTTVCTLTETGKLLRSRYLRPSKRIPPRTWMAAVTRDDMPLCKLVFVYVNVYNSTCTVVLRIELKNHTSKRNYLKTNLV